MGPDSLEELAGEGLVPENSRRAVPDLRVHNATVVAVDRGG